MPFSLLFSLLFLLGEIIEDDFNVDNESCCSTKYKLTGIVVHSGQASGGHYYSYILHRLVPFILMFYYFNFKLNRKVINFSKISMFILSIPLAYTVET